MRMTNSPTAPKGAYWRSIAWKFMFLAALRYFSDSERNDVDRCDIPAPGRVIRDRSWKQTIKTHGRGNLLSIAVLPCSWSWFSLRLGGHHLICPSWKTQHLLCEYHDTVALSLTWMCLRKHVITPGVCELTSTHQSQQMRTVSVLFQLLDHMCLQTPLRARLGMRMPICEGRICPLLWGIRHYRRWGSCYTGSERAEYIRDLDDELQCIRAAFNGATWFGIWCYTTKNEFGLLLVFL